MTQTLHAIFENGVFRPTEKVNLPDHCAVEVEVRVLDEHPNVPSLDEIYSILSKRFDSGEHDVAARHNEHQP
jgi:predicted DNA-binding antitoxin AbrB/MazE fold protein